MLDNQFVWWILKLFRMQDEDLAYFEIHTLTCENEFSFLIPKRSNQEINFHDTFSNLEIIKQKI